MADWSQMPKDLLGEIADRLDAKSDIVRYRSVCSMWRESVAPTKCRLSSCSPVVPNDGFSDPAWGLPLSLSLSKRTVFLIGLPDHAMPVQPAPSWVIKTRDDVPLNLLNPLTRTEFTPLPGNFPRILDTLNFRVLELATEYVLQYMNFRMMGDPLGDGSNNLYMERVAFMCLKCAEFVLLTIHVSGKLAVFKSRSKKWTLISDMPSPYDDVILHKGEFYAVDGAGRIVTVGLDLTLKLIAGPVFGGDKKFLVESVGELMLVDKYLTIDTSYDEDGEEGEGELGYFFHERTVKFRVYKLDMEEHRWIEVRDIGDKVLFLGDDCRFSTSSSDLKACRGNCIIFSDDFFFPHREGEAMSKCCDIGVYDIGTGKIGPLEDYKGYPELFWPPPAWITSKTSNAENQAESLPL